jgi:hypothetical protein
MEHLSDNQLLEMVRAQGSQPTSDAHLTDCADCRQRLALLQESWNLLGQWSVDEPSVDLTAVIMSKAQAVRCISLVQPRAWVRIAASIAVGLGVGSLVARPAPAPQQQINKAVYVEALALNSATGWTHPLLTDTEGE